MGLVRQSEHRRTYAGEKQSDYSPPGDNLNVSALNFTQFLSPYFGVTLGKYATLTSTSGDMNEFATERRTQFMNLALNFNPIFTFDGSLLDARRGSDRIADERPKEAIVSFMVLQSSAQSSTSGFSEVNQNLLTFAGEGRIRTDFFGLTGHQLLGATTSNREFKSIDQSARFIIQNATLEDRERLLEYVLQL